MLFFLIGVGLSYLTGYPPILEYITLETLMILVLTFVLFRYSRALMLNLFGGTGFDPKYPTDQK